MPPDPPNMGRLRGSAATWTFSTNLETPFLKSWILHCLVGGNVFNFASSPMLVIPSSSEPVPNSESSTKPFVLKIKTNQIRVCQSCRKDYSRPKLMIPWSFSLQELKGD